MMGSDAAEQPHASAGSCGQQSERHLNVKKSESDLFAVFTSAGRDACNSIEGERAPKGV